eukprot:TRINITY_DN4349_c0_g1_i1.p1 TRINITY_DN4349_c0_g1~~TRINITY_DN4349_c0_g1_i1.p1  ORF type:complete len:120 (-),score=28.67 TRINITY_DN4349_c0_g1_i1:181-540(-)
MGASSKPSRWKDRQPASTNSKDTCLRVRVRALEGLVALAETLGQRADVASELWGFYGEALLNVIEQMSRADVDSLQGQTASAASCMRLAEAQVRVTETEGRAARLAKKTISLLLSSLEE